MTKVVLNIATSLDGYIAGLHDEVDWLDHYSGSGDDYGFKEFIAGVGAVIMGRRSYDLGVKQGWFKKDAYGPSPIFVISKDIPADNVPQDTDFRFITTGIEDAYREAKEAAASKNVYLFGGASIFQQFLSAGFVDEMHLSIAPVILGKGIRLFDNLVDKRIDLERIELLEQPEGLTGIRYRIIR